MCDHDDKHTMTSSKTCIFHSSGRSVFVSSTDKWPPSFIPTLLPVFSSWTQGLHVQFHKCIGSFKKMFFLENKSKKISGSGRAAATESSLLTSVQLSVHRELLPCSCLPLSSSSHTRKHTRIHRAQISK